MSKHAGTYLEGCGNAGLRRVELDQLIQSVPVGVVEAGLIAKLIFSGLFSNRGFAGGLVVEEAEGVEVEAVLPVRGPADYEGAVDLAVDQVVLQNIGGVTSEFPSFFADELGVVFPVVLLLTLVLGEDDAVAGNLLSGPEPGIALGGLVEEAEVKGLLNGFGAVCPQGAVLEVPLRLVLAACSIVAILVIVDGQFPDVSTFLVRVLRDLQAANFLRLRQKIANELLVGDLFLAALLLVFIEGFDEFEGGVNVRHDGQVEASVVLGGVGDHFVVLPMAVVIAGMREFRAVGGMAGGLLGGVRVLDALRTHDLDGGSSCEDRSGPGGAGSGQSGGDKACMHRCGLRLVRWSVNWM